jgi:hypothetical protein
MRDYYDFMVSFDLKRATPAPITDTLTYMVRPAEYPFTAVPAHPFFRLPGFAWRQFLVGISYSGPTFPGVCDSYFDLRTKYAAGTPYEVYTFSCRQTIQDDRLKPVIVPAFLDWLMPYINTEGLPDDHPEAITEWGLNSETRDPPYLWIGYSQSHRAIHPDLLYLQCGPQPRLHTYAVETGWV